MKRLRNRALLCLAAFVLLLGGVERPPGLSATSTEVRHWSYPELHPRGGRALGAISEAKWRSSPRLAACTPTPRAKRPERLYLDLSRACGSAGSFEARRSRWTTDCSTAIRHRAEHPPRTSRVVLDLEHYERHRRPDAVTIRRPAS